MSQMSDAVTQLTKDVADMRGEVNSAVAFAKGVPDLIAKATADAQAAGATPAQLQSLTDLHTSLASEVADLHAAFTTNTTTGAAGATGATGATGA